MDWLHTHIGPIRRAEGKSAVGLAAYVTGQRLWDEESQRPKKRGHPGEVNSWGSTLPENAPSHYADPKKLGQAWNDHQKAEVKSNSILAIHDNVALNAKFSWDDCKWVMESYAQAISDRNGVMVTWAVHAPTDHGDARNKHGHLAIGTRRLTSEGFGDKARELVAFHLRRAERRWQREVFCDLVNQKAIELGLPARITPASFEARGIDRTATKHLGNDANMLELRGIKTKIGDYNREARADNQKAKDEDAEIAARILKARSEIIHIDELQKLEQRKKVMSDLQPDSREFANRQQRQLDDRIKEQQDKLGEAKETVEASRRFFEGIENQKQDGEKLRREQFENRTPETDITDANQRFMQAAAERFDIRRPEASLSEVVAVEGARAKREHNQLTRDAAQEKDLDKKADILLRRDIMHADYMAITSERLVGISNYVGGRDRRFELDEDGKRIPLQTEAEKHQAQADFWKEQGEKLRTERTELHDLMDRKVFDKAINQKDTEDLQRWAGFDPNHMDPGRYHPIDHHLERVKGMPQAEGAASNPVDDRREMHRAMQTERQLTDPRHEVTGRVSEALRAVQEAELTPAQQRAEEKRQERNEQRMADLAAKSSVEPEVAATRAQAKGGVRF